jgi:hypothetical protein
MRSRYVCALLPVVLVVLASGCGDSGNVSGVVRYKDGPLKFGTVQVRGSDGVVHATLIDSEGNYTISGLPSGPATVSVTCRDQREVDQTQKLAGRGPSPTPRTGSLVARTTPPGKGEARKVAEWSLIPVSYADFDKSGLNYTVRSGSNQFDIDLK